jgi:hypothetical protein
VNDRDLDAEFERIIARWDEQAADPQSVDPQAVDQQVDRQAADPQAGETVPAEGEVPTGVEPPPSDPPASTTGLSLSIAPLTPHAWRAWPSTPEDPEAVLGGGGVEGGEIEDDHFEPPTLTDLPNAEDDPMFWAIVVGLGGGPLLLFYLLIFDRDGSGWWVATALAMTVVGFVMLVLRGGNDRDPSDDGTRV